MNKLIVAAALALLAYVCTEPIYIGSLRSKYGFIFPEDMVRHRQEAQRYGLAAAAVVLLAVSAIRSPKKDD